MPIEPLPVAFEQALNEFSGTIAETAERLERAKAALALMEAGIKVDWSEFDILLADTLE